MNDELDSDQKKIFICPTPIGNLRDITLRALDILRQVDVIACEDTRRTGGLLSHYDIETDMISYHEHNARKRCQELLEKMKRGKEVALVSDAGTPGISDPGRHLISEAIEAGIEVIPLPGPTALIPALVASGLLSDRFVFEGFLPKKGGERQNRLKALKREKRTSVLYESPYRTIATISDLAEIMPARNLTLIREISKIHEEKLYGTCAGLSERLTQEDVRGEVVLVLAGKEEADEKAGYEHLSIVEHVRRLMDEGYPKKEAIKIVAEERELSRSEVYEEAIAIDARPEES
ncbi:16S rRNA (cytidine(1402)-2'-O)-methyltransferase [Halarsenatibacter silvermanii]|uniref:Ribosomal RNA small subunit methyltransferase I n=1 Tax=Halarsenatibacter silvermanii TaxID=321763 RepID=A0A1G9QYL4_9FIRM|nr:16S rRNA (cytidine(1402)-2'-O)-methyltransferase [Halarsenatibacter silvermanii]SDM16043.1 16S rRNA (cytidine1402-2'-O)-methyltransferase [Halarsenatibacter silvermanii]